MENGSVQPPAVFLANIPCTLFIHHETKMVQPLLISVIGLFVLKSANAFAPRKCISFTSVAPRKAFSSAALSATPFSEDPNNDHNVGYGAELDRRGFVIQSIATGFVSSGISKFAQPALADEGTDNTIDPSIDLPKITQKVYMDIKYGNYKTKRLTIGLFGEVMPKAVENFQTLCANSSKDNAPTYAGTSFYRVIPTLSIQGGAIGPNSSSGKSGTSVFNNGDPFAPDNFKIKHTKKGLVSAVRCANGDIDSRFFIQTENDAGWADGRYAAFGIVLEDEEGALEGNGMDMVKKISRLDVKTPQNSPKDPVLIVGCGLVEG